jgi:hypothetical protein
MSYAAIAPLSRCTDYRVTRLPGGRIAFAERAGVGEFYLRQWPLVVAAPRVRSYRLARAAAGLGALNGVQIPDKLTPLTADEAAQALATAYQRVTGKVADQRVLGLLIGQTALETGNWQSLHNFNFGNAKATPSDPYYQGFRCWEVVNGAKVWYEADHPACQFAAHLTAADGAEHYVRILQRRPHWWAGLESRTVPGFVAGLTTRPVYFTADPDTYAKVLSDRMGIYASEAVRYAGQATEFAGKHKVAVGGTAIGVFALTFGSWYLYNAVTSKKRAA